MGYGRTCLMGENVLLENMSQQVGRWNHFVLTVATK